MGRWFTTCLFATALSLPCGCDDPLRSTFCLPPANICAAPPDDCRASACLIGALRSNGSLTSSCLSAETPPPPSDLITWYSTAGSRLLTPTSPLVGSVVNHMGDGDDAEAHPPAPPPVAAAGAATAEVLAGATMRNMSLAEAFPTAAGGLASARPLSKAGRDR